jgi:hypothetical protein
MKRKLSVVFTVVAALMLASVVPAGAKAPLTGDMELQFNLGFGNPAAPQPSISWVGTIELDGELYGMAFFPTGSGKPFVSDPSESVHFFREDWKIYAVGGPDFYEFEDGVLTRFEPPAVVLEGYDQGVLTSRNDNYHGNGVVEGATAPFEEWLGRHVQMNGDGIEWYDFGAPRFTSGTFRFN